MATFCKLAASLAILYACDLKTFKAHACDPKSDACDLNNLVYNGCDPKSDGCDPKIMDHM
jgi:hypothetical protein